MPIIIEGPDGAGKSTLAKPSADRLGMNILKMAADGGQSVPGYLQKPTCDGIAIDRCRVSGQIYSDIFDREARIDNDDAEALAEPCGRIGIQIIVLLPPPRVVIGRLDERGDEYADAVCPNITGIYARYRDWAEAHGNAIAPEDDSPETAMAEVLECML